MTREQAAQAASERRRMARRAQRLTAQAETLATQVQQLAAVSQEAPASAEPAAAPADPQQVAAQAQRVAAAAQQMAQEATSVAAAREELADALATQQEQEQRRLRQVLDLLPEAVLIADATPRVVVANAAAGALLGVDAHILVGSPPLVAVSPAGRLVLAQQLNSTPSAEAELPLQRAVRTGLLVRGEQLQLRTSAGTTVPILANAAPLREGDGRITGGVLVFQDITALRDLDRRRDEFLAAAAHDLRTPLTAIRGYTQLAQRHLARLAPPVDAPTAGSGPMHNHLQQIADATTRMLGLTGELVDVLRLQVGGVLDLERRPTDLVALVRGVVEHHQRLTPQHLVVEAALPTLDGVLDAARIERVVVNLLANAIKYSPPTSTITLRVTQEAGPAGCVGVIAVQDEGVGIPAADLPHIFERFRRASNVVGHIQGTGIGLASALQIVEQHGGAISVESQEGHGATFTVRLPLEPEPERG